MKFIILVKCNMVKDECYCGPFLTGKEAEQYLLERGFKYNGGIFSKKSPYRYIATIERLFSKKKLEKTISLY